ncbi:uncharacterized protein [Rutidosis leptorrhynchoides]|uniref:uncharacterized protein n=1 Tax=Rutidosis leptorrhynchoides TaxID=125765 RepID=UPI003A991403
MAKLIDDKSIQRELNPAPTLKNNLIPIKVGIFVWRLLRKRIAVRVELDRRGIDLGTLLCPLCNDVVESVDHAIFSCKSAQDIWNGISKWWNLSLPPGSILDDLIKCSTSIGVESSKRKIWQAVVWVTCYLIWKNRNLKVFKNDCWAALKVIAEIQVKTYEWIKNRSRKPFLPWQQWLLLPASSPLTHDPG